MRGSDTCELVFENCEVPKENVLGQVMHDAGEHADLWHSSSNIIMQKRHPAIQL